MNSMSKGVFAVLCLLAFTTASASQIVIEVFTDQPALIDSIAGAEVVHYDLSEPDRLKRSAIPKLSPDQEQAMKMVKAFFASPEGEAFKDEMKVALRGKQKMIQYQLKKVPAVVFDQGAYVVYGITDVSEAARLYGLFRHQEDINDSAGGEE